MLARAGTGVTLPGPCVPGRCAGQPPGEPPTWPGLTPLPRRSRSRWCWRAPRFTAHRRSGRARRPW